MSEASRARRQRAINLREELLWREQQAQAEDEPPGIECDPSWGPVGSLLARLEGGTPLAEVQSAPPEQTSQNRVLSASGAMSRIDQYGETPLFACPRCGEDSAKASVPLDYWRCTACSAWGKASTLAPRAPRPREVWDREPL